MSPVRSPKRRRFEIVNQPRFLTFSCYGRLPLFGTAAIRDAFVERLNLARRQTLFKLLAWVIMPEHVHLIIVPRLPAFPISRVLSAIKRPFAEQVIRRWRELDASILRRITDHAGRARFWLPGGGYDRNIVDNVQLDTTVDYTHVNPVRRGLVKTPYEWAWSSARWYAGLRSGTIAIDLF